MLLFLFIVKVRRASAGLKCDPLTEGPVIFYGYLMSWVLPIWEAATDVCLCVRLNLSDVISIDVRERMRDGKKATCNNTPLFPDVKKLGLSSTYNLKISTQPHLMPLPDGLQRLEGGGFYGE